MSSVVGTRRGHVAGTSVGAKGASRLSATRSSRAVRRQPSVPAEPHGLPAEIQRNRILSAAIRSLDEVGYAHASVAHITSRARVSRRTFYELFPDRDACLLAAFEGVLALIERDLASAGLEGLPWRERVRLGLWTILSFLEREPAMANVCVVQSLQGDAKLLARRDVLLTRLAAVLDEGRHESLKARQATPLTAEGLVGAALSIVYTRLLRVEREPLTDLLGELMGLIVLPYLGPTGARREQTRPAPAPLPGQSERGSRGGHPAGDPFDGLEMRLTYRTLRVLECVAANPGASNRQVGIDAGVPDQGQISKLLSRLERLGLLENTGKQRPKGEANAWELTSKGVQMTQTIRTQVGTPEATVESIAATSATFHKNKHLSKGSEKKGKVKK
ncbi:MAG TPA: TetR/AcrR family transcriptional regulator [Solirubrobacteraceae bacterium]|jgi:AcrR family transcriptional regulator|nr:TetR/AcrR family transcriptional regulator [Solirubrobacteraceae bacterium]